MSTPVFAQKIVDRGEMAMNNFLPPQLGPPISLRCQTRAFEELVGHSLKGRNHDNKRSSPRFLQDDLGDISDAIGRCKQRAAKFQDFHWLWCESAIKA